MRVWIDSEVILDCLYEREGCEDSLNTLKLCEARILDGCISAATLVNISKIMETQLSTESTVSVMNDIARIFTVADLGKGDLNFESISKFDSFEKGLDAVCAKNAGAKYIVTRGTGDYGSLEIVAVRPDEIRMLTDMENGTFFADPLRNGR